MFIYLSFNDFPRPWQLSFQKPATTMMEGIIDLHHDIFAFLIVILVFVSFLMGTIFFRYVEKKQWKHASHIPYMQFQSGQGITHDTVLEIVWTVIPTLILLFLAAPSFALIYALDDIIEPELTLRVVGRQWYWTYEYPDSCSVTFPSYHDFFSSDDMGIRFLAELADVEVPFHKNFLEDEIWEYYGRMNNCLTRYLLFTNNGTFVNLHERKTYPITLTLPGFAFNSYIVPTEDLFPGSFRLLEVDHRLVLPAQTNVRVLVTSYDVLHSWTVPSFGIKVDAVPGRLNEYFLRVNFLGIFYGQCSEICGVNHGFMPIKVEVVTNEQFKWWFLRSSLIENDEVPVKFLDSIKIDKGISDVFNQVYALRKDEMEWRPAILRPENVAIDFGFFIWFKWTCEAKKSYTFLDTPEVTGDLRRFAEYRQYTTREVLNQIYGPRPPDLPPVRSPGVPLITS